MCAWSRYASGRHQKSTFGVDLVPLKFQSNIGECSVLECYNGYMLVSIVSILKQIEQLSKWYHFGIKLPLKLLFLEVILDLQKNGP